MGRPPKKAGEKRQLFSVRFDPAEREAVEAAADKSGRSVGAEIEARVKATLGFDEEGLALISAIGSEIQEIQKGFNGKRWHKDLTVWSAVVDMFRTGPIMATNPDNPSDDEAVSKAYAAYQEAYDRRQAIIDDVAHIGVAWLSDPKPKSRPKSQGLFGNALAGLVDGRLAEKAAIKAISDDETRRTLSEIHDEVCSADDEVASLEAEWIAQLRLYWDAEREGRAWNRARQKRKAQQAFEQGEPVDYFHLSGTDPWFLKS